MSKKECIICGKELSGEICEGVIKGMKVNFCDLHANQCEGCDNIYCKSIA
jgi:hypothetical protein